MTCLGAVGFVNLEFDGDTWAAVMGGREGRIDDD